jgi:AcrR family transcriptional regulator
MTGTAATPPEENGRTAAPTRRTRKSVALSKQTIVERAVELAESEGVAAVSLRRISQKLGVDATAFYRYFREKDDLVLAMFDEICKLQVVAIRGLAPDLGWREKLTQVSASTWETARRYPAIFSLAFGRTTGGPAEREIIEFVLATVASTGLPPEQAVLHYRIFADTHLGLCGTAATMAALDKQTSEKDANAWSHIYAVLPEEDYPAARAHASELAKVTTERIYFAAIEGILDGIAAAIERTGSSVDVS